MSRRSSASNRDDILKLSDHAVDLLTGIVEVLVFGGAAVLLALMTIGTR